MYPEQEVLAGIYKVIETTNMVDFKEVRYSG